MRWSIIILTFLLLGTVAEGISQTLSPGPWRGELDYGEVRLPVNFSIEYKADQLIVTFRNGEESIEITEAWFEDDSLVIPMIPFDTKLKVSYSADRLEGYWVKGYSGAIVSFSAKPGSTRFQGIDDTSNGKIPVRLPILLNPDLGNQYEGIAMFNIGERGVEGTILTEVGDYRYFEGIIAGDSMALSSFDGAHSFLFVGTKSAGRWSGKLYLGKGYAESWVQSEDDLLELRDPFEIQNISSEGLTPYYDLLAMGSGKDVLKKSDFEGIVTVLQIFGTWCPNSYDQTNFLRDWRNENPSEDVQIIGLAYELNYSREYGMERIRDYKEAMQVPYEIYLGGSMNKSMAAMAFEDIRKLQAFPTLLFLDKEGKVRKVHSYFNGPATGKFYQDFKPQFDDQVRKLLEE